MNDDALITDAKLLADRNLAFQIEHKGVTAWIPKSQVVGSRRTQNGLTTFSIPEWLAAEKKLEYT